MSFADGAQFLENLLDHLPLFATPLKGLDNFVMQLNHL